jgi:CubicO group peptidase (beta-lactamase class C family)
MADLEHDVPITPRSVFHVASISKQFTTYLCVLLARDGELALDDDIRTYLPELPIYGPTITLRHLIHHTSGLRDQWNLLNLAGWREHDVVTNADVLDLAIRQSELDFPVGDEYQYSNTGYTLLGLIVERVTGKSLRAYAEERIFGPLGMTHTHFHDDHTMVVTNRAYAYVPRGAGEYRVSIPAFDTVGATSLFTTVEDLALWVQRFLAPSADDDATDSVMLRAGVLNDGTRLPYAGGLVVRKYRGLKTVGHSGGDAGYRAHVVWFPDQRFGVIVLGNVGALQPDKLARQVADMYLADQLEPLPPTPVAVPLSEAELAPRVGLYWNGRIGKTRRLELRDGALRLVMWPGYSPELIPTTADRFVVPDETLEFSFVPNDDGSTDLREIADGTRPELYRSVEAPQVTPEQLVEYIGAYRSDEVGTTWTIERNTEGLIVRRFKSTGDRLVPAFVDGFLLDGWEPVVFHRNDEDRIDGFALSSFRLRRLFFRRAR